MANTSSKDSRNMKRLKDEQQIRQRPAPTFGTNDERGACASINEIIANSIDEAREGYGKSIRFTIEEGNIVTIEDDGRGLPMDWNEEEEMYNWELALCTLYASGKYDSSQYGEALGLNGLGLTATQFASSFMDVWSTYGGKTRYMHFEKGRPIGEMKVTDPIREGTGTKIKFQPDPEVFPALRHVNIPSDYFLTVLRRQAMLLDGLEIVFNHFELNNTLRLCYKEGIKEFVDIITQKNMLPEAVMFFDSETGVDDPEDNPEPYEVKMKMAFNFSKEASLMELYHNGSIMFEGGISLSAIENGFSKAFTECARNCGKLARGDKFLFKDIEKILVCIANTDAPGHRTWFKNQTKGAINNPFISDSFTVFVYNKVRYWIENNKQLSDRIINEVYANKIAREEADKVSKKVINTLSKAVSFGNKPKDFNDASSKNVLERELYIVEGLSALSSVKLARDYRTQGVMPVRGKPINCLKEKLSRVLNNDIIVDLYRVLGCGLEAKSEFIDNLPEFNMDKLNWGKIIICTDADVDGMHIRCLLITMFYILSPSLLKAGKVFIAETPLYTIEYGKNTKFAFDESEKEVVLKEARSLGFSDNKIKIERSKGLGENDPEMMNISTMNPATRRLIPVDYVEDDGNLASYFNALLGDDLETRRILIEEYFDQTSSDFD